jgi:hypothetical protein
MQVAVRALNLMIEKKLWPPPDRRELDSLKNRLTLLFPERHVYAHSTIQDGAARLQQWLARSASKKL